MIYSSIDTHESVCIYYIPTILCILDSLRLSCQRLPRVCIYYIPAILCILDSLRLVNACPVSFPIQISEISSSHPVERWGAGVETQKNVRGEVGGWGRVPFNEPYAPSLSTIYDGA